MDIQEAKQEVINTVRAYTAKDENGCYRIPALRQRPVLLIGPPGIGKTAIVEQAAQECGVGLVAYTITHHTRQSAVGLPLVEKKLYDGREVTVTEYTMSEIIASVYECMKQTGCKEGILFIDEVNCVSETLAPTMLQFLQGKTFGNHKVPKGWVIVAAGNPPEYNKSVREFDIVTLDRVKKIEIDVAYEAWRGYAVEKELHGAIRMYLDGKTQNFYYIEQNPEEKIFVTARGWEDLSAILLQYEQMGVEIKENLIKQYIQCDEIAHDFASYYAFYRKYQERYQHGMEKILQGDMILDGLEDCTLDEQLTITNLLISQVLGKVASWRRDCTEMKRLFEVGQLLIGQMDTRKNPEFSAAIEEFFQNRKRAREVKEQMDLISENEFAMEVRVDRLLQECFGKMKEQRIHSWQKAKPILEEQTRKWREVMEKDSQKTALQLDWVLCWVKKAFGIETAFLTVMECYTAHPGCMELIREFGSPVYAEHCHMLMTKSREKELIKKIKALQETPI